MRTIAFVTQKGGSGKSTLASSLAVAAMEAGEKVCIVDLDPQGSLVKWAKARARADVPVVASTPAKVGALVQALAKQGFTYTILDTPGVDGDASSAAAKSSDLVVIPSRPNAFDLWASAQTCSTLKSIRREFVFLLNQCPPAQQSARVDEGVAALEALGGLISPLILSRVDYQEAARSGLGVTEVHPSAPAAEEIRALWSSLKRRIARLKGAAPTRKAA
jgi:chromosome partitioning protein